MKLIITIIKETNLDRVRNSLIEAGIERLTVTRVSGHGRQKKIEIFRGRKYTPSLLPKIRLEIAVNDNFVSTACEAISQAVKSESKNAPPGIGEGKIFIISIEDCIRIRTGEKGSKAILNCFKNGF